MAKTNLFFPKKKKSGKDTAGFCHFSFLPKSLRLEVSHEYLKFQMTTDRLGSLSSLLDGWIGGQVGEWVSIQKCLSLL